MNDNWKFLAGLGVGLVLSSLLFIGRPQTQDKLTTINQARSLGMIFPQEGPLESGKPQVELKEIKLEPKMTAQRIATLLAQEGIIADQEAFLAQVEERGLSTKFIAGRYRLGEAWPLEKIIELLTEKKH